LALYEISQDSKATTVAGSHGRNPQTVMRWVHRYNTQGPAGLLYWRSGGRPLFCGAIERALDGVIREAVATAAAPPGEATPPPIRWTLKRLAGWIEAQFSRVCSRETVRRALRRLKLSWKKTKKLLGRADPERRAAFVPQLQDLLKGATHGQHLLVYWDEAHIHQETDLGYGWSVRGEWLWVCSNSPGRSAKVSFYRLYLYHWGPWKFGPIHAPLAITLRKCWSGCGNAVPPKPSSCFGTGHLTIGLSPLWNTPPAGRLNSSRSRLTAPISCRWKRCGAGCVRRSRISTAMPAGKNSSNGSKGFGNESIPILARSPIAFGSKISSIQMRKNSAFQSRCGLKRLRAEQL
jgi:transposase